MPFLSGRPRVVSRLLTLVSVGLVLASCSPLGGSEAEGTPDPAAVRFSRILDGPAVTDRASTGSGQWVDVDGNGHLDLFVSNGYDVSSTPVPQVDRLYLNDGSGRLVPAEAGPVTRDSTFGSGATWGDFDDDGHVDVFIPAQRGQSNRLYRNLGEGRFESVTGEPPVEDGGLSYAASWVDMDGDGHLDLSVSNGGLSGVEHNFLYRNRGDGTFERVPDTPITGTEAAHRGMSWGDCTGNGLPDLFVARGWSQRVLTSALYRNDGNGRFTRLADSPASTDTINAFSAAWGDFDNDGALDLIVGTRGSNRLYRNEGGCRLTRVTEGGAHLLDGGDTYSIHWADHDNDGRLDILAANWGSVPVLYTNSGDGRFERLEHGDLGRFETFAGGASWGDFDGDGFLDLFVANWPNFPGEDERNHLYRNEGGNGNHWLGVRLVGTTSNRSAIGARVRVRARVRGEEVRQIREVTGSTGFRSQDPLRQHFGLGDASGVEEIEVWWPSGVRERFPGVAADQVVVLTEGEGQPL